MDFEPGISCVFVAPGRTGAQKKFRVQRITDCRYVIELEGDNKEVLDPMTKATLKILEEMAKAGKLTLLSHDEAHNRFAALRKHIAEGDKLVEELKRRPRRNRK